MTQQEIVAIIEQDSALLQRKTFEIAKHDYKMWLRQRKNIHFPGVYIKNVHGNRGLDYIIAFSNKSEKDLSAGILAKRFAIIHQNSHIYVIEQSIDYYYGTPCYMLFSSHFFDRYRERVLHNTLLSKMDTIKVFIQTNGVVSSPACQKDERYPNGLYLVMEDCMAIGKHDSGNLIEMKTCISNDEMYDDQKKISEVCKRFFEDVQNSL